MPHVYNFIVNYVIASKFERITTEKDVEHYFQKSSMENLSQTTILLNHFSDFMVKF